MLLSRQVASEGFAGLRRLFCLMRVVVARALEAKTPDETQARRLRARQLSGSDQQVVKGH